VARRPPDGAAEGTEDRTWGALATRRFECSPEPRCEVPRSLAG